MKSKFISFTLLILICSSSYGSSYSTTLKNKKLALDAGNTAFSLKAERRSELPYQNNLALTIKDGVPRLFSTEITSFSPMSNGERAVITSNTTLSGGVHSGPVSVEASGSTVFEVVPVSCTVTSSQDEMYPYNMEVKFKINTDPVNVQNLASYTVYYSYCGEDNSSGDCTPYYETTVSNENTITFNTYCSSDCTTKIGNLRMDYYDGQVGESNIMVGTGGKKCVDGVWSDY